jgi:hypothetical protein
MKHFVGFLLVSLFSTQLGFAQQAAPFFQHVEQVITVEHGDYIAGGDGYGYCRSTGSYNNEQALTSAAAAAIVTKIGATGVWGIIATTFLSQVFDQEIRSSGGSIKEWLENFGAVQSFAACGNVTLAIPDGAKFLGVQGFATDAANGWQDQPCFPPDGNGRYVCKIGWSEWIWSQNGRVVTGIFVNWSGDRTRKARLGVMYVNQ